jgi:hypothetical protein
MHTDNLTDFFAGLAMQGLLSAGWPASDSNAIANIAYDVAQAMMEERTQRKEQSVNDSRK